MPMRHSRGSPAMRITLCLGLFMVAVSARGAEAPRKPTQEEWQVVVNKATAYLKNSQKADGDWSESPRNLGVTGVVVTGLLQCNVSPDDEPAATGRKCIESLV